MQINDIKTLVARLGAIVDGWDEQSGAPSVERHIAASLLAELYEAVKFDTALAATEVTKVVAEPDTVEKTVELTPTEEEVSEVIDLSDIFGGSSDDEEAEIAPEEVVDEPIEEIVPEEIVPEEVVPEEVAEPEIEPEPEELIVEEAVEEAVEQEPIEEQPVEEEVEVEVEVAEEQPIVAEPETPAIDEVVVETQIEMQEEQPVVEEEQPAAEEAQTTVTEAEQPAETEQEKPAETEEEKPAETEEKPAETEQEKPKSEQASLFDMEIVRRPRSSSGRRVIMSLYGESTTPAPREKKAREQVAEPTPETPAKPETPVAPKPDEQPTDEAPVAVSVAERIAAAQSDAPQVLGDVIGAGTTTLADAMAAHHPTAQIIQNDRVNSLRTSIGINDRFIMIRDLFGGDGAAFDRVLDELDAFDDFNECLVYMSTYRWNPNSDGARMMMDLVTRKLL